MRGSMKDRRRRGRGVGKGERDTYIYVAHDEWMITDVDSQFALHGRLFKPLRLFPISHVLLIILILGFDDITAPPPPRRLEGDSGVPVHHDSDC